MKKAVLFSYLLVLAFSVQAQRLNPVKWSYNAIKTATNQYDIVLTATIDAPWHMYSQFATKGPIPTTITFKANPLVKLNGKTKEIGKLEKNYDKNFGAIIGTFTGKVDFKQAIILKAVSKTKVSGTIEYTVCNDEKCLPPVTIPFEVAIQ
jgi:hypothetical protein